MPFVYDATMKELVGLQIPAYASYLHFRADRTLQLLNVDLSTISAATDVVIGIGEPVEEIVDLNFQSGPDSELPGRVHLYSAVLYHRKLVPVRTIIILLCPRADHPNLTGLLTFTSGRTRLEFQYEVIRLWEQPAEELLKCGLGVAVLAVLGRLQDGVPETASLQQFIQHLEKRIAAEANAKEASKLSTATVNLMRLRISREELETILKGTDIMKTGYELLLEDGEILHARKIILRLGPQRLGAPSTEIENAVRAIDDLDRLDRIAEAISQVKNWEELLETP